MPAGRFPARLHRSDRPASVATARLRSSLRWVPSSLAVAVARAEPQRYFEPFQNRRIRLGVLPGSRHFRSVQRGREPSNRSRRRVPTQGRRCRVWRPTRDAERLQTMGPRAAQAQPTASASSALHPICLAMARRSARSRLVRSRLRSPRRRRRRPWRPVTRARPSTPAQTPTEPAPSASASASAAAYAQPPPPDPAIALHGGGKRGDPAVIEV